MSVVLLRFRDLKQRKIVNNPVTLNRWIRQEGFPPGFMLGPNTRVWREADIDAWIDSRPVENERLHGAAQRKRGGRS
jgi:predicted DNA-binding transcriptional regulator AlpA